MGLCVGWSRASDSSCDDAFQIYNNILPILYVYIYATYCCLYVKTPGRISMEKRARIFFATSRTLTLRCVYYMRCALLFAHTHSLQYYYGVAYIFIYVGRVSRWRRARRDENENANHHQPTKPTKQPTYVSTHTVCVCVCVMIIHTLHMLLNIHILQIYMHAYTATTIEIGVV